MAVSVSGDRRAARRMRATRRGRGVSRPWAVGRARLDARAHRFAGDVLAGVEPREHFDLVAVHRLAQAYLAKLCPAARVEHVDGGHLAAPKHRRFGDRQRLRMAGDDRSARVLAGHDTDRFGQVEAHLRRVREHVGHREHGHPARRERAAKRRNLDPDRCREIGMNEHGLRQRCRHAERVRVEHGNERATRRGHVADFDVGRGHDAVVWRHDRREALRRR